MQQLTRPTQTIVHHTEESSHLLSTVWLKERNVVKLEMALFPVNTHTGNVEYGDPVFTYSVHASDGAMPDAAMDTIQALSHAIMLRAFHANKCSAIELRCETMIDAYERARGTRK